MDAYTNEFLEQVVSEEFDNEFAKNMVDIAVSCKSSYFRNLIIEGAIDYLAYKNLKECL